MILSNAARNWASVRSGLGLGDFLSSLTPEREQEILKAYNAWRRSKGLPEDKPVAPTPSVPTAPTPPPAKREESAIAQLMEQIADEVEKEQEEDAILIGETIEQIDSIPVEEVPEEIATQAAEEAEPTDLSVDIDEGTEMAEEEPVAEEPTGEPVAVPAAPSVDIDEAVQEVSTEAPTEETPTEASEEAAEEAPTQASSISDRFAAIARKLPREGDPDLYAQILEQLGGSVEALRMAAQITWEEYRRRHKGTAAISAFLNWLNGQSNNE